MIKHFFLMIHGMVTEPKPQEPWSQYQQFWKSLTDCRPQLLERFTAPPIEVEWGHQLNADLPPDPAVRNDQALTRAQQYIHKKVSFDEIKKSTDPNYKFTCDMGLPVLRNVFTEVREGVGIYGLGDVVYYCSTDGETQVRRTVYGQVLKRLDEELTAAGDDAIFYLHAFGHSLGVTVIHDFLFGLFNPDQDYKPGFMAQGTHDERNLFDKWRQRAGKKLFLGGLSSAASQLPLLLTRSANVVSHFYRDYSTVDPTGLNPGVIGVKPFNPQPGVQWKIFYDLDDILGFSCRGLYWPNISIQDIQVANGSILGTSPTQAHIGYWQNDTVIKETADLLLAWSN